MTVRPFHPPGHFSSPIVDPEQVRDHMAQVKRITSGDIGGISINFDSMRQIWLSVLNHTITARFPLTKMMEHRFYLGGPFPFGDALFLRMMMTINRPRRIVEIGSGFSTACMLDVMNEIGLDHLQITCIEPYPDRLFELLRPEDNLQITLMQCNVQDVPLSVIYDLEENDILFIDSSHVLKTGSDVHFELFEMLPRLSRGVLVHFHDVPFPFEYPEKWVLEDNFSWNEAYAVRAFLMYNSQFSIEFWGSAFRRIYRNDLSAEYPALIANNPGTSLWIRRTSE